MALVRIYQKPTGTPANSSVFAVEIRQNNIWYTKKVSWEDLKGLIAGATSLVFNNGTVTFTTPDGVAHEVLSVDDEVLAASGNPVTGGAVSTALAGKQDTLTFDQVPTDGSTNPVESNGIYDALAGKQDTLTFDTTPTDGSTNPVTSQGIYAAISAVTSGIDWKEAVPTYADIATTYPNPQDGWTVTTLDDDHTYRYTGTEWVDLFSLITLATSTKDGLMSSADFTKLSGIEAEANKTIVSDTLTPTTTTKKIATITAGSVAKDINADDTVKVITDLKTPKSATITNGIAQFECIEENLVKGLKVTMNPIQDLSHGDPSPTNICPISGRTEVSVVRTGKNLFQTTATTTTIAGVTYTVNDDGTITVSGTATGYSTLTLGVAKVNSSMGYVSISGILDVTNVRWGNIAVRDVENNVLYQVTSGSQTNRFTVDLSQYPNADNIIIAVKRSSNGAVSGTLKPQVELNTIETGFEPYQGETHTHQYGQTVYGGTDDFVNGDLSVEWGYIASYDGETLPGEWLSDRDVYAPDTTPTTGAEVAYKLSTPTTIQTSAENITTVEGTNIISGTEPISECKYTELATVDDLIKIIGGQ